MCLNTWPLNESYLVGAFAVEFTIYKFFHGEIFDRMNLKLNGTELYREIRYKQAEMTFDLIRRFLNNYPNVKSQKQLGEPTFYPRRNPSDSEINIDQTIRSQFNLLRICNNKDWPAFFEISGVKYRLKIEKIN